MPAPHPYIISRSLCMGTRVVRRRHRFCSKCGKCGKPGCPYGCGSLSSVHTPFEQSIATARGRKKREEG